MRDWSSDDAAALVQLANNPSVARNMRALPSPYLMSHALSWVRHCTEGGTNTSWAIECNGKLAGAVALQLRSGPEAHAAAIGYWLGEPFWGRGIATAVVRAVSAYAFGELDLKRLDTTVIEWNQASMRVLEKCGFVREGVLRRSIEKESRLLDRIIYARLASD